jgi:hypothetical protein
MLSTEALEWGFLLTTLLVSLLGAGAGALTSFVLRRPWGVKVALLDAVVAAVVFVSAAWVISEIAASRGIYGNYLVPFLAIAVAGVVLRHLLRLRRAH